METTWSQLGDFTPISEMPRVLTAGEIESILDQLPNIDNEDEVARDITQQGVKLNLLQQLQNIEISPTDIPWLTNVLINRHKYSLITPGDSIGITAATAVGSTITQATLNTFHASGTKKSGASSNMDSLRDIINTSPNLKFPTTIIHFENKMLTYKEALNKRMNLVSNTPKSLLLGKDHVKLDLTQSFIDEENWWYIFNDKPIESTLGMRLYFDISMLYKYQITLEDIANLLSIDNVVIISPMQYGIIDIFPSSMVINDKITSINEFGSDDIDLIVYEAVYLIYTIYHNLGNESMTIKGVPGVVDYSISSVQLDIIVDLINKSEAGYTYRIKSIPLIQNGISADNYERLANVVGLKYTKVDEETFILSDDLYNAIEATPKSDSKTNTMNYYFGICYGISNEDIINKRYTENDRMPINLSSLLKNEDLDLDRIISNDIFQVTKLFGIEKTRETIVRLLYDIIGDSINFVHIESIADIMCISGLPKGANFVGISQQNTGHLTKASFERAGNVIASAALIGEKESTDNVSVAISAGTRMIMGTGKSHVILKSSPNKILIDDQVFDISNFSKVALSALAESRGVDKVVNIEDFGIVRDTEEYNVKGVSLLTRYPQYGQEIIFGNKQSPGNMVQPMLNNKNGLISHTSDISTPVIKEVQIPIISIEEDEEDDY